MKSKDVEVGKVYGYREGKSVFDATYQVKFLAPLDDLYTYGERTHKIRRSTAKKTHRGHGIYPPDGYLVARGHDVSEATLEDALETGVTWGYGSQGRQFNYAVITNMAAVIGPDYATAHAAQEAARAEREAQWDAAQAQRDARRDRSQGFVDRLALHGVEAWKGEHGGVEIWGDEADKLLGLLDEAVGAVKRIKEELEH